MTVKNLSHAEAPRAVVKLYRDEIARRTSECATQADLDELNAALRGVSIAEVESERVQIA